LDDAPSLSIGDIKVNNHALWVGTGEANTSSDSYAGTGVFVSTDGGANFSRVGGEELQNTLVRRIVFDGAGGVYAATSKGLFRRSLSAPLSVPWTRVLYPWSCSQSGATPETRYISDVVIRPGSGGRQVIAVVGWRAHHEEGPRSTISFRGYSPRWRLWAQGLTATLVREANPFKQEC
jgi:hypothetical protein